MNKVINFETFKHLLRLCSNNTDDAIFLALMIENYYKYSGCRFPISAEDLQGNTGLSPDKSRRCYKRLYDLGFIVKTVKKNQVGTPINHYEVDVDNINAAFDKLYL